MRRCRLFARSSLAASSRRSRWLGGGGRVRNRSPYASAGLALVGVAALLVACTGAERGETLAEPTALPVPTSGHGPPPPPEWVVTLGDSYISGAGARWAGNTSKSLRRVDALGADVYLDVRNVQEGQPGCHRAEESIAELDFSGVRGKNLACSGATTTSQWHGSLFKPGLDSYSDGNGHRGQVAQLKRFAQSHDVTAVVVSIGGNDFGFAPVLAGCVSSFVLTVGSAQRQYCSEDPDVTNRFTSSRVQAVAADISAALGRVSAAMSRAGYSRQAYRLIVLTYPGPVPPGAAFRYPETLRARYVVGGCPLFNADATWAGTALDSINSAVSRAVRQSRLSNVSLLDMSRAFVGHRLCERGVGQLEEVGLSSWRNAAAVDRLEWVSKFTASWFPWQVQESVHPGYFGMLAERSCVRQALRATARLVSRCVSAGDGLSGGEPRMALR